MAVFNVKDLALQKVSHTLVSAKPEYKEMLVNIDNKLPAALKSASNFYKDHSQFMQVTLDVTTLTPLRSIYQSLAEIEKTRTALQENTIKLKKSEIECRRKRHQLESTEDPFDRELLELEIFEYETNSTNSQNYIEGAVRKLNFFINQYENILAKIGKTEITEEDYEREESRYHIMTCMKQALNAARSRNGMIDEGNLIYLFDLGINAAQAQAEIIAYLSMENKMISEGNGPTHEMTVKWLEACADKWADDPSNFASMRGFSVLDESSLTNKFLERSNR
tara:strand:- start:508 stop:1344 length:837 start_codon:yes stop_codon:yes gene_type:complete